jgi:hypothetical protein
VGGGEGAHVQSLKLSTHKGNTHETVTRDTWPSDESSNKVFVLHQISHTFLSRKKKPSFEFGFDMYTTKKNKFLCTTRVTSDGYRSLGMTLINPKGHCFPE